MHNHAGIHIVRFYIKWHDSDDAHWILFNFPYFLLPDDVVLNMDRITGA